MVSNGLVWFLLFLEFKKVSQKSEVLMYQNYLQTRTKNDSFFFNVLCQHILDKGPFIYAKISMLWRLYIYWYFEDLNILQIIYICWELSLKIFSCSWFGSDWLLDSLFILPGFYPSISYGFFVCDLYRGPSQVSGSQEVETDR